ncbi:MAG: GMC family oxidoreductase N-terminal domain-containing protein [Mariniblastus sp.]
MPKNENLETHSNSNLNSDSKKAANSGATFSRRTALKAASVAAIAAMSAGKTKAQEPIRNLVQFGKRTKTSNTPLKQRAMDDYRQSLQQYGGKLSSSARELFLTAEETDKIHFGVVVIGSGYGASIAAAKLSQHLRDDYRICILERGKEWLPGTFPDTFAKVSGNARAMLAGPTKGQVTQPLGLFNLMMNDEVNILSGNGLGGGSLVNASIALRPHMEVFQQSRWPMALQNMEVLGPYYDRVAQALSLSRTPCDQTPKVRLRREAAARMSSSPSFYDRSNISVMYDYRHLDQQLRNKQGMIQRPCTLCGDCINGCNIGAKNTLAYNYLPVARHNGTEMFTQVQVDRIEKRRDGTYRIHGTYIDDQHEKITRHSIAINTHMVVVGAGSPSSATILMDSENENLKFSPQLGHHWSGNGDTIGFVVGMEKGTNIGGHGAYPPTKGPVGPTVQTSLNFYRDVELRKRLLIQDAAIPRGVTNLFTALLRDPGLDHSMAMLGMGHDEGRGRLIKKDGRWQVKWEGLKESEYRKMAFREFDKLARAHGGRYKRLKAFGDNLVTVHPLGSCGMSDSPECGPVNHLGQVYDYNAGGYLDQTGNLAVHHGLYVADGSVIPTALGVNPYMTIGALSDRIAEHIVNNPAHANLFG